MGAKNLAGPGHTLLHLELQTVSPCSKVYVSSRPVWQLAAGVDTDSRTWNESASQSIRSPITDQEQLLGDFT